MMQSKNTKHSLIGSALSLILCCAMLIGATFAWFTDSVINTGNIIQSGNLDVELEYADFDPATGELSDWKTVEETTDLFNPDARWEPGYADVVYLRISNLGTLALKYRLGINIENETSATNVNGEEFKLSQYLQYGIVEDQRIAFADRETAIAAVSNPAALTDFNTDGSLAVGAEPKYMALVVYMPTTVGNEANYRGDVAPSIDLGLTLVATQDTVEEDGFDDPYYDQGAWTDAIMKDNGNGTYTDGGNLYVKMNAQYIAVTADQAVSGLYTDAAGNNYVAEADAVKSVFAQAQDGENIIFIDDVSIASSGTDTYVTAENVTIDLNNKTVSVDYGSSGNAFAVTGDGSVVKNGTFKCTGRRADYPLWITGNIGRANILVENVTIEGGMQVTGTVEATLKNVTITANTYYDVYMAQDSRVTVESGSFTSTASQPHFYIQNYRNDCNPTVILNGGDFSGGTPTYKVMSESNPYTFTNNINS